MKPYSQNLLSLTHSISKTQVQLIGVYTLLFISTVAFYYTAEFKIEPRLYRDSYDYISLAGNIQSALITTRPIGYPLLIKAAMFINNDNWKETVVFIQILLMGINSLMVFNILKSLKIRSSLGFIFSLIIMCSPSLIAYSNTILADSLLSFCTTTLWFITIKCLNAQKDIPVYIPILIGIFSGFTSLVKPVWIVGGVALALSAFLYVVLSKKTNKYSFPSFIILFHFVVYFSWQQYSSSLLKDMNITQKGNAGNISINGSCIYLGLTQYGEGTPLYNYMKEVNCLQSALTLKHTDSSSNKIEEITRECLPALSDPEFGNQILKTVGLQYVYLKFSRFPEFFTIKRGGNAFSHAPQVIQKIYQYTYDHYYVRRILAILSFISLVSFPFIKAYRSILFVSFAMILYYSTLMTFLICLTFEFSRMRIAIDPILYFTALLPILFLLQKQFPNIMMRQKPAKST